MQLQTLTDYELLRIAHNQLDPLTSTELEAELLRRFEVLVDEQTAYGPLLDEFSIETAEHLAEILKKAEALDERINGIALLDVLREFDFDNPAALKKALDRDAQLREAQLRDVLDSLAKPMADLQALAA